MVKRISDIYRSELKFAAGVFVLLFFLSSCFSKKETNRPKASSVKFDQYYLQGEQLYQTHCSNCHQKNGRGLGRIYPPLDTSDFMNDHFEEVICLMDNGRQGELIVNGKNFNKPMPGIPSLTDLEIAEIATYIYNSWSHQRDLVDVKDVRDVLSRCKKN
jgi:mono/diheme cytochrome c family protein